MDSEEQNEIPHHSCVDFIVCPECKQQTKFKEYSSLLESLSENKVLSEMCERIIEKQKNKVCGWCEQEQAIQECSKCEVLFCEKCKEETHKRSAFESHQFYDLGELEKQKAKTCAKHKGRRKDLFCNDCNESLCLYCTKFETNHKNHSLSSFAEANKVFHQDIKKMISRYESVSKDLLSFQNNMKTVSTSLTNVNNLKN